ncbi:hypothetical protein RUM44_001971 [Polyplax serrata]|uniref:Uncharacterized protein n=1 Tax=Polyplax serrata TaxID=468196 RepID=A0ABR1AN26_POLSC
MSLCETLTFHWGRNKGTHEIRCEYRLKESGEVTGKSSGHLSTGLRSEKFWNCANRRNLSPAERVERFPTDATNGKHVDKAAVRYPDTWDCVVLVLRCPVGEADTKGCSHTVGTCRTAECASQ